MKKFTFLWVAISLISLGSSAQNLLLNPGFEDWTGGAPLEWSFNDQTMVLTENTSNVYEGAASCQVLFTSQTQSEVNLISNTFVVTPGEELSLSAWFLDNDPAGRATLSILYEGAGNFYSEMYTEDGAEWQQIATTHLIPDGAVSAQLQIRFYDISGSWDGDAEITVDAAICLVDNEIKPEPSNYPTAFTAAPSGVNASISWTDATGDQLPQKYLVMAAVSTQSFTAPVDGTTVEDDTDISDGNAVLNISFGEETAIFGGLAAGTAYHFTIFPYTNSGSDINYKTDGTAPTAALSMPDVSILSSVDFEDDTYGGWETVSVIGDQAWEIVAYGNPGNCAKMSGYDGAPFENEDWLISPAFNLDNYSEEVFTFETAMNYSGPALELYISSDYESDPATATWEMLNFTPSGGSWEYVSSGDIDLASYTGTVNLGFKFTSNTTESATWEIDNILLTAVMSNSIDELSNRNLTIYPNPGYGWYQLSNPESQSLEISIYNVLGQLIQQQQSSVRSINIDLTNEKEGVYLVHISGQNISKTVSLIKK